MRDWIAIIIFIILPTIIPTFFFIHFNYKKYSIFSTLNDFIMFKKMVFNKRCANCSGKKITLSYFFLIAFSIIYLYLCMLDDFIYDYDDFDVFDNVYSDLMSLIFLIVFFIIFMLILRLVYEFIVIPISIFVYEKTNMYQQNAYAQSSLQQYHVVAQSGKNAYSQSQQPTNNPISTESQFRFCTQCGTRYNESNGKCPNCGMK